MGRIQAQSASAQAIAALKSTSQQKPMAQTAEESAKKAAPSGDQQAPTTTRVENLVNQLKEATFEPSGNISFTQDSQGRQETQKTTPSPPPIVNGLLKPDPIDVIKDITNVPMSREHLDIEKGNRSAFTELLNDMSPKQLQKVKAHLKNEVANIDPMTVGSTSLAPDYLKQVNQKIDAMTQTQEAVKTDKKTGGDKNLENVIKFTKKNGEYFFKSWSKNAEAEKTTKEKKLKTQFKQQTSQMTKSQLIKLRDNLEKQMDHDAPKIGVNMTPEYLQLVTVQLGLGEYKAD